MFMLAAQSFQRCHVILHALFDSVRRLVIEVSLCRGNIEDAVTLFAPPQLARPWAEFDAVIGKQFRRCVPKIPWSRRLPGADIERPFLWRRRVERKIHGATDVAYIHRVV